MDVASTTSTPLFTKHILRAIDPAAGSADPPADPDRDVHCAALNKTSKHSIRKEFSTMRDHALLRVMTVPAFFWIGVILTVALTVGGVLSRRAGPIPGAITGVLLASLVIPGIVWMKRRSAPKAPKEAKALMAPATDERFRLRLISTSRLAWALRDLSNQPFEPQVFAIPFSVPARRWVVVTVWLLASAGLYFGWWWLRGKLGAGLVMPGGPPQAWEVWGVMAVAATPFGWAWPAYLRVSPGRIDVFRYPLLGAGKPTIKTFDVRHAKVTCQGFGEHGYIMIEPPGEPAASIQLSRWGAKFHEVFKATFEAARWRGDLVTLPDDELVG
ncbi:MAG: hypothetical protein WC718_08610 [Phycisphaerales bacterium]|jgi:hypothetical protein